jgi:hypothetical protein
MDKMDFPIDFVITWVDSNDEIWQNKRNKYRAVNNDDKSGIRFRDYGTLKYVFRAIDNFAPWVNKIYLITDHQAPNWLKRDYPKLILVNHEDFIDRALLPTFNSNVIDLNMCNIEGLSEHFVYFNDDMFLNGKVTPRDFFDCYGRPRDTLGFNAIMPVEDFDHIHVNNLSIVNKEFSKKKVVKHLLPKLFNFKNFEWNIFSLLLLPWPRFTRFFDPHIPISYRKSVIETTLEKYPEISGLTGVNKFRSKTDYSLWVVRYFELLSGEFLPRSAHFGKRFNLDQIDKITFDIDKSKHKIICINDTIDLDEQGYTQAQEKLQKCFLRKYSKKSRFEA